VIHHGGAGTTAAALRAGTPSLILPFFFDQAFWAHRLYELGIGPKPLSSRQISVEAVASEIRNLNTSREIQKNAQRLASGLQNEDGVSQGVAVIRHTMGDGAS
jgi:UDP:flavonoid glycosyltransferase YjiC (YdhE family)